MTHLDERGRAPSLRRLGTRLPIGELRMALAGSTLTSSTCRVGRPSVGSSEEFVGRAVKRYSRREDIVRATKVSGKMHDGPGGQGLSRKATMEQIDASLTRLGTDYVDLYLIHRFDPETPVEETMKALHDVAKAGKARYLGASSKFAWQFAKLQHA